MSYLGFKFYVKSLFILSLCFICCCAHSKFAKEGIKLAELGDHWGATIKYFESLRIKPGYETAIDGLRASAKPAYEQKLKIANSYEEQSNYESALEEYKILESYCDDLKNLNLLTFAVINFKQKISDMKSGASEKYYVKAEKYFSEKLYLDAISSYNDALQFNSTYKDCRKKITKCHYLHGNSLYSLNKFKDAVQSWKNCWSFESGYEDTVEKASKVVYALGRFYEKQENFRAAYYQYEQLLSFNSNYKDTSERKDTTENNAITKIAFMPFKNISGTDLPGIAIDDVIFELTKSLMLSRGSKFIRLIDREELHFIMNEQGLRLSGITENNNNSSKIKSIDFLVFGKINRLRVVPKNNQNQYRDNFIYTYRCIKQLSNGKKYESSCSVEKPFTYVVESSEISIEIGGSVKILQVNTGRTLVSYSIKEGADDSVQYVSSLSVNHKADGVRIPEKIEDMISARRELRDKDEMIDEIVKNIASQLGNKILHNIDITKSVTEPTDEQELYSFDNDTSEKSSDPLASNLESSANNNTVNTVIEQPDQNSVTIKSKESIKINPKNTEPFPSNSTENLRKVSEKAIHSIITSWASAWSKMDVNEYLSFYSNKFRPSSNLSLNEWKRQRAKKLNKAFIKIKVFNESISFQKDFNEAIVVFEQYYETKGYKDFTKKKITFEKNNDKWLIIEEKSIN